jgi:hypothetical protein
MAARLKHKRGRGGGWPDVICESCDTRASTPPPPFHSIPGGLPFSPPPLFFLLGIMGIGTTYTTSLLLSYTQTHTHIHTSACGTKYPPPPPPSPPTPSLARTSHMHTQTETSSMPAPCARLASPRQNRPGYAVLVLLRPAADISPRRYGRVILFGGFAPWGENRENPLPSWLPPLSL